MAIIKKKAMTDKESNTGIFASCSFSDLGLHPSVCQHFQDKMGFKVPTKIQAQSIPIVISGRDVLVNAATGTGKTIVYLAPIVHLLQLHNPQIERSDGTFGKVVSLWTRSKMCAISFAVGVLVGYTLERRVRRDD